MARIALVTWDGGGNVSVALGIALALVERGHTATVIGPRSLRETIEALALNYAELGVIPPRDPRRRHAYLQAVAGADGQLEELRRLTVALRADAVVLDCNLAWALQSRVAPRTAVLVHTALGLYLPAWQAVLDAANARRAEPGLTPLPAAVDAWGSADRLLVASLEQFDRPPPPERLRATYVGPVADPRCAAGRGRSIPLLNGDRVVLVSYSTDCLQNGPERLQTALDGLAELPVTVLATTSGVFAATQLRIPANANVLDYLAHETVMPRVALTVCHAGHGTTMAALRHGVPLICVPGVGRDQAPIAARVAELGLGIALRDGATADDIKHATATVLADGRYRRHAQRFIRETGDVYGARRAATELETMLHAG